jgi:lipopolysaccharide transport system ATP-binding protein
MAFINVEGVAIDFPLYHGDARSLKKMVLTTASGRFGQDQQKRVVVQALRDISFSLKAGDRLALVGRNGAGKTTLLRTLAGIYEPLIGQIKLSGKLSTLLDSSLGMNVDMSGRENITLRGLYNGMSSADINRMAEDVAEFAELGEFLELPVKFYSSGMVLRLAFAMATAVHPEILLMDEWMLAGDANFMEKARARVDAFVNKAEILVLSTHNEEIVLKWATRVIWMDQGRIIQDGPAETVLESYLGRPPIHPVDKLQTA